MKTARELLEALQAGADLPFPAEAVAAARAVLANPSAAAADVVVLPPPLASAVLEHAVRTRNVALAEALGDAPDRALAKAAKKALYQLRSMGVAIPEKPAPVTATPAATPAPVEEPLSALISSVTGMGERALIIARPLRGASLEVVQVVFTDELGVLQLERHEISRSAWRRQLKEIRGATGSPVVELPAERARALLGHAVALSLDARTPFPPGLDEVIRHLSVTPQRVTPPIPAPEPEDARLAIQGHSLHEQPEIQAWLPPEPELRALVQKMDEVLLSPLELTDAQRTDQMLQLFRTSARAFFTPAMKRLYGARLWEMAELFEKSGRPQPATIAAAEARRLFHDADPNDTSRFTESLFEKVLMLTEHARAGQPLPEPGQAQPLGQGRTGAPPAPQPTPPGERKSPGGLILP